jgi:hypothetical protein
MSNIQLESQSNGDKVLKNWCWFPYTCIRENCKFDHRRNKHIRAGAREILNKNKEILAPHRLQLQKDLCVCKYSVICNNPDCPLAHCYTADGIRISRELLNDFIKGKNVDKSVPTQSQRASALLKLSKTPDAFLTRDEIERVRKLEEKHARKREEKLTREAHENPKRYIERLNKTVLYKQKEWEKRGETLFPNTTSANIFDCDD